MPARVVFGFMLAVATVFGACGETLEPIQVRQGCPQRPLRGPQEYAGEDPSRLIDDFESGDGFLSKQGGRQGRWVLMADTSSSALIAEASQECTGRGVWAGHFSGRGFMNWGSTWTATFQPVMGAGMAVSFDGSSYSGVSFWAAFGEGNGEDFAVPLGIVTLDNAWNGGRCSAPFCGDFYVKGVTLTHTWQRYVVPFASMEQGGWGIPQVSMRKDQMVGFVIWPKQQFDIWIDDLRLEP